MDIVLRHWTQGIQSIVSLLIGLSCWVDEEPNPFIAYYYCIFFARIESVFLGSHLIPKLTNTPSLMPVAVSLLRKLLITQSA